MAWAAQILPSYVVLFQEWSIYLRSSTVEFWTRPLVLVAGLSCLVGRHSTFRYYVLYIREGSAGPNVCGYVCSVRWRRELSWSQGSMPCTVKVGLWHRPQENTRSTARAISAMARRVNQPSLMLSWGAAKTLVLPVSSGIHRYTTLYCWVWAHDCALDLASFPGLLVFVFAYHQRSNLVSGNEGVYCIGLFTVYWPMEKELRVWDMVWECAHKREEAFVEEEEQHTAICLPLEGAANNHTTSELTIIIVYEVMHFLGVACLLPSEPYQHCHYALSVVLFKNCNLHWW